MTDIDVIHVHDADGRILCGGQDGESISLDEAPDSGDGKHFTCGACLTAMAGVIEPTMGGSRP